MVGIALGFYEEKDIFNNMERTQFTSQFTTLYREEKYLGWQQAVESVLINTKIS